MLCYSLVHLIAHAHSNTITFTIVIAIDAFVSSYDLCGWIDCGSYRANVRVCCDAIDRVNGLGTDLLTDDEIVRD